MYVLLAIGIAILGLSLYLSGILTSIFAYICFNVGICIILIVFLLTIEKDKDT